MDISTIIILIVCSIIGFVILIKFLKWGIKNFSDDEIMKNFSFKCCFASLGLAFWVVLVINGIFALISNLNELITPEMKAEMATFEINKEALMQSLPTLIGMLLVFLFIVLIVPLLSLIYFHRHKKELKMETYKNYTYKQIARKHFIMGLFSPIYIPLLKGPSIIVGFIMPSQSNEHKNKDRYTTASISQKDSNGNITYVDTVIDNETGYRKCEIYRCQR